MILHMMFYKNQMVISLLQPGRSPMMEMLAGITENSTFGFTKLKVISQLD